MFRQAWKTCRSCSPASDSMCADSPARRRLAGCTVSPRASSTRVTGSWASQCISRSGCSARSSRAIATSRSAWPRPIGLETNSARARPGQRPAPAAGGGVAGAQEVADAGVEAHGIARVGRVARALEGAPASTRRWRRGRARQIANGRIAVLGAVDDEGRHLDGGQQLGQRRGAATPSSTVRDQDVRRRLQRPRPRRRPAAWSSAARGRSRRRRTRGSRGSAPRQ